MSVQKDADDASEENPSSLPKSPSAPPKPPPKPPPPLPLRFGWHSASSHRLSGSTSPPSRPSSWSKTVTLSFGAAHHAIPSNPEISVRRPPPIPGLIPRADACAKLIAPPASRSNSPSPAPPSSSASESNAPSESPSWRGAGGGRGIEGSSTYISISLNHAGLVVV